MKPALRIRQISSQDARTLRSRILRPNYPLEINVYPGDDANDTYHVGAFLDGILVGIASVFREPSPFQVDKDAWRLRGMAVEENTRRMGCGKVLVINCISYVVKKGGDLIWCNARVGSMPFYQALGFQAIGEEFDIAESGPHYVMWRKV